MPTGSAAVPSEARGTCVVTGASGYVGSAIAAHLTSLSFTVVGLSRSTGFALERRDIAWPDTPIDALVHCAYDFATRSWDDIRRVNVEGSLRLLEAARRRDVGRIVFLSSLAAFDGCDSLYGRGKRIVEDAVLATGGDVIRPGTVFGPRPRGLMGALEDRVGRLSIVPVPRHAPTLSLVHEADLAQLSGMLVTRLLPSSATPWLAAGPRRWSLADLVREIARRQHRTVRVVGVPWPLVWGGLRAMEAAGLGPSLRSDSVLSLARPIPDAQLARLTRPSNVSFRDY